MDNETKELSASGKVWRVESIPHADLDDLVTKFHLEHPKASCEVVEDTPLTVAGWALSEVGKQRQLHLVLRFRSYTVSHPMNTERRDVVKNLLSGEVDGFPQIQCGFNYTVPLNDALDGFEIGFEADGFIYTVFKVYVAS